MALVLVGFFVVLVGDVCLSYVVSDSNEAKFEGGFLQRAQREAYWVLFLPVFERIGTCRRGIHRSLRIVRCGWSLIVLLMIG
ncbi:hypothetical protein, partial [Trueperella pyogenes]